MNCWNCSHRFGKQRQPICPSCARSAIYDARFGQAIGLLDREKLHGRVQTIIKPPSQLGSSDISTKSQLVEVTESARKVEVTSQRVKIEALETRLEAIKEQQRLLRRQIDNAKKDNERRVQEHLQLRSSIHESATRSQSEQKSKKEQVAAEAKRLNHRLAKVQKHTIEGRQKLCMETALLAGLTRRRRRRGKDGGGEEDRYSIGGIVIPDLRELNTVKPDTINACLAHITRLLLLTSHYLAVRLPAEVIGPHPSHPHPCILSLTSSYRPNKVAKPRHLTIHKPPPLLAKEEPALYSNFLEGMVLLAYDIAWLSRAQGQTHVNTFADFCSIGANLHALFLAPPGQQSVGANQGLLFGEFSHASAQADLKRAKANTIMQRWELPGLARIQDMLKSHLLTEMSGAEWEVVEEREWGEEREDERAVMVGGDRWRLDEGRGTGSRWEGSVMTAGVADHRPQQPQQLEGTRREDTLGMNGWTKLRVRSGEPSKGGGGEPQETASSDKGHTDGV